MRIFLNGTYQPWNWGLRGTCPDLAQLCSSPFNICSSKAPDDLCCFCGGGGFCLSLSFSEFWEHFFPFHPPSHRPLFSNSLSLWPFFCSDERNPEPEGGENSGEKSTTIITTTTTPPPTTTTTVTTTTTTTTASNSCASEYIFRIEGYIDLIKIAKVVN